MGVAESLKGIIEKFRATGKSEKEISGIIERASDKATVNREAVSEYQLIKPKKEIETFADSLREALTAAGIAMKDLSLVLSRYGRESETELRKATNNWRRMHGLPMRRKRRRRRGGNGKRADCHPKNADVS